ncbi:unnamed protein product, partial [marine sediment metagenome]
DVYRESAVYGAFWLNQIKSCAKGNSFRLRVEK